ncbi:MAG: cyclic nucleotide-binding domain-containing protein [Sinobacterium sp.]|nr:cyclic nucleotide-binding domain-containing protein [Sinobacterium sp.]
MKTTSVVTFEKNTIQTLLGQIPFFKDLMVDDNQQFQLLLKYSTIIELDPAEIIVRKGDLDKTFYFLLKGQLEVFAEEERGKKAIGQLSEGQVFGALSIINDQPRTATLAAPGDATATIFATDFSIFGELEDTSQVKINTKSSLLRIVINNTRWKLEVNRMNTPNHPLANKLDKFEQYNGLKNTEGELTFLADQAFLLGQLLDEWNLQTTPSIDVKPAPKAPKGNFLSKLFKKK